MPDRMLVSHIRRGHDNNDIDISELPISIGQKLDKGDCSEDSIDDASPTVKPLV